MLIQVSRRLENITSIAYVSVSLMLVMTVCMAVEVSTSNAPGVAANATTSLTTVNTWEWFVFMGDHPARYNWANVLSAIGTFVYSCLPVCIAVETMAALEPTQRGNMKWAVDASFVSYVIIYLVSGSSPLTFGAYGGHVVHSLQSLLLSRNTSSGSMGRRPSGTDTIAKFASRRDCQVNLAARDVAGFCARVHNCESMGASGMRCMF